MKNLLLVILLLSVSIQPTFASSSPSSAEDPQIEQIEMQVGQPVTQTPDGIDIYPTAATADGENHYIHIGKSKTDSTRYVFQYCRNGLPPEIAEKGYFPQVRDCYYTIGNSAGYTKGELQAEIQLMQEQGKSQERSSLFSSVGSSVISGIVVLFAINVVEAITTKGKANEKTDAEAIANPGMIAKMGHYLGVAAIKKIWNDGSKLIVSTVFGTFTGQVVTNRVSQATTHQINENPFSSPSEEKYEGNELNRVLTTGSVVIIQDNMEVFESDVSQILVEIQ